MASSRPVHPARPRVAFALLVAAAAVGCGRTGLLLDDVFDGTGPFGRDGGGDGSTNGDGSTDGRADGDDTEAGPFDDAGTIDIGPVTVPNLPQVTAGDSHACVRTIKDEVFCWGLGAEGQLGNRSTDPISLTALKVEGLPPIARVSAGRKYSCALGRDQTVWCWGENLEGQLGRGTRSQVELEPAPIAALTGTVALSAGGSVGEGLGSHTCSLDQDGAVWCWGRNSSGECALGTSDHALVPNKVALGEKATAIAAGGNHTCALLTTGKVSCWGRNDDGQLGFGQSGGFEFEPEEVFGLSDVVGISAGDDHSCAIVKGGAMKCWGDGFLGELGDGKAQASYRPVDVVGIKDAVDSSGGVEHECMIHRSGTVSCWGKGVQGELGIGSLPYFQKAPVFALVSGVVSIATGSIFTCAGLRSGQVSCWGGAAVGQLGYGPPRVEFEPSPVMVLGL